MPWIKITDEPPDYNDWLKCDGCGHLALKTKLPNLRASEIGEPCKYCDTPYRPATYEDMKKSYPHGQYEWKEEVVKEDN